MGMFSGVQERWHLLGGYLSIPGDLRPEILYLGFCIHLVNLYFMPIRWQAIEWDHDVLAFIQLIFQSLLYVGLHVLFPNCCQVAVTEFYLVCLALLECKLQEGRQFLSVFNSFTTLYWGITSKQKNCTHFKVYNFKLQYNQNNEHKCHPQKFLCASFLIPFQTFIWHPILRNHWSVFCYYRLYFLDHYRNTIKSIYSFLSNES